MCVNVCAQLQPERHGQIRRHQTLRFPDATRAECFIIQLLHPAILPTYRYNSLNTAFTRLPPVVICSAALAGLSKQPCSISSRFFRELRCFCWFIHQNTQADNLTGPCSNTGLDRSSMQLSLCFSCLFYLSHSHPPPSFSYFLVKAYIACSALTVLLHCNSCKFCLFLFTILTKPSFSAHPLHLLLLITIPQVTAENICARFEFDSQECIL